MASPAALALLAPEIAQLLARLIRCYAPRSVETLCSRLPQIPLADLLPLRCVRRGGDIVVAPPWPRVQGKFCIIVLRDRREELTLRQKGVPPGYRECAYLHFGLFILPFLWLRFFSGGRWLLRKIFALEIRLHPYLKLLGGIGALWLLEKNRPVVPRRRLQLSCVIPAYNEAERLPRYLAEIRRYLKARRLRYEIVIADDGSTDGTAEIAQRFGSEVRMLRLYENFGKGAAVREGVLAAQGEFILVADADGATPIHELARLEKAIAGGADIAIGSRYVPGSVIERKQGVLRRIVSRTGNWLIRLLLGLPYRDTQCGFKLFTRSAAFYLFRQLTNTRFGYDFEILKRAELFGLSVAEVPVRWTDQQGSKVTWKLALRVLSELLRFRFGHLAKFFVVGVFNTLADFSVHNILIVAFGYGNALRQLYYMIMSFLFANLLAFCLHSGFTFRRRAAYLRFFTVSAFTLSLSSLLFYGLNRLYNSHDSVALANLFKFSTVAVSFITNYFGYRFWVYRYAV
ncbi:MAG: bifunctional glycosyltransferase family 2/GtrA family protein [Turneriella sp.]|nr:bifunctional glycosyltransferase family 2/GtrA family protein [Turneriella sp.]